MYYYIRDYYIIIANVDRLVLYFTVSYLTYLLDLIVILFSIK